MPFTRAIKLEAQLRLASAAPRGAGNTYTGIVNLMDHSLT
jgi:hypothetical protein